MPEPRHRQRIVIVGAGFAGFHAARTLSRLARHLGRQQAAGIEIVLINPTDYFLYLPLLPEVAGGVLDPRRVAVPLPDPCPVPGCWSAQRSIDLRGRRVSVAGPEGDRSIVPYDRLLLTAGSVNKLLPVPGIAQHSHGFRSIAEALYLRDHLLRQLELAASGDHAERAARCTFVVVGAGYTRHRGRRARPATHPRRGPPGTPACAVSGSAGCCSTRPRTCCPNSTAGSQPPRTVP